MTSPLSMPSSPSLAAPVGPLAASAAERPYWRRLSENWLLVLAHLAALTCLYSALYSFGIVELLPGNDTLVRWDAGWYQNVQQNQYTWQEGYQSNVAFFPLFPYFWRFTDLSPLGISLTNMLSASVGLALLGTSLQCSRRQLLLLASLPLLMFTLVPYTEAFFYLFGAVLLVGLQRQQTSLLLLGLLGCCLTRSAAVLLLPALVFAEVISWLETRASGPALRNLGLGLLTGAASIGGVNWMQHKQTGVWLAFYKAHAYWGQHWQWPQLPLKTTAGVPMLWLEGISFGIALMSLVFGIYLFASRLGRRRPASPATAAIRPTAFALVYCVLSVGYTLFQQGGDIVGSSRYVLGTPFCAVLLWQAWRAADNWRMWGLLVAALLVVGNLLGVPNTMDGFAPGQATWYFALLCLYAVLLLLAGSTSPRLAWRRETGGAVYVFNLVMLALMLNWFMLAVWLA